MTNSASKNEVSKSSLPKKKGGRKKGVPNKVTAEVQTALIDAFERMGGVTSLVQWGKKNPTEFYKLWVKLLPAQIRLGNPDGSSLASMFARALESKD